MRRDGYPLCVDDLAMEMQEVDEIETIYQICEHLSANGRLERIEASGRFDAQYTFPHSDSNEFPVS